MPRGDSPGRREARLKPEYAHLYPPLKAGKWQSASVVSGRLVAWLLGTRKHGYLLSERVRRPEHFEFRGGERGTSNQ